MVAAALTCAAVRHESFSTPAHCSVAGSNPQANGFSIRPSVAPSRASHAARTALLIVDNFAADKRVASSFSVAVAGHSVPAIKCVQ